MAFVHTQTPLTLANARPGLWVARVRGDGSHSSPGVIIGATKDTVLIRWQGMSAVAMMSWSPTSPTYAGACVLVDLIGTEAECKADVEGHGQP